ncbi:MAG: flavodoxin family protein [candidate division KSB1 bacterium]|nr:flavodoxin family protein [candidate division KSB1 bacterium]
MSSSRRHFIKAAGAAALVGTAAKNVYSAENEILIVGVACSPRKGKTTATSMQAALDAAQSVDAKITTEMIDLGGKDIAGWKPQADGQNVMDDFELILPSFKSPNLGGIIIGTPVYFRNMSSLCAAFLERLGALRKPTLQLANNAVGALSVGGYRNGGQELAVQQIQTAMLCHEAVIVGGKPGAFQGATLWNDGSDDITKDEFGMTSAKNLGKRVAEAALMLK